MKITEDNLREIESKFKAMHEEAFEEEQFVFDPVTVKPTVDSYGEDSLHIVVVYDGEYCSLDPYKLIMLGVELSSYLEDRFDFCNNPIKSHIHKSEYAEWLRLSSLPPWERWDE